MKDSLPGPPGQHDSAALWMQRGEAFVAQRAFEEAAYAYHQACVQDPDDRYARFWLGECLFHLGRFTDTVSVLAALDPGADTALALEHAITLGRALHLTGRAEEAELTLLRAFMTHPNNENAAYNLAVFYEQTGQPAQALQFLEPAAPVHPHSARLHYNLGVNRLACGQSHAAVDAFHHTLQIDPTHLLAHQNLALVNLSAGQLRTGWTHYAWRFNRHRWEGAQAHWMPHTPDLPVHMVGVTVELVGEQGLGDELFFLRFVPALAKRGATISYRVGNDRLLALLQPLVTSGLLHRLVASQAPPLDTTLRLLVGDLPLALGLSGPNSVPEAPCYPAPLVLQPTPHAKARMLQKLPSLSRPAVRPRVGLTWRAGTPPHATDFDATRLLSKEVPLAQLLEILQQLNVDIVVLQRNPQPDELRAVETALGKDRVLDASGLDQDLCELLALLSCLDGLVGVSNTNVHLMAALGKGGQLLVPFPPEFRWQSDGDFSPWFAHFRVARQNSLGDWSAALAKLPMGLSTICATTSAEKAGSPGWS